MAGKVNMSREGSYAFDFCPIGQAKTFSNGDKLFHMQYDLIALLRTNLPGRADPPRGCGFSVMGLTVVQYDPMTLIIMRDHMAVVVGRSSAVESAVQRRFAKLGATCAGSHKTCKPCGLFA
jgi:hypothetical protein